MSGGAGKPCIRHPPLCALLTQVVLPAVLGLVLVGEAAVKRSGLVVLDFGLDVFGHDAEPAGPRSGCWPGLCAWGRHIPGAGRDT